jgi:hypothetical protein|tara:strand:+ start:147 stop:455 length:309 start_codon:yes stop_codon:yes gene_type:complete
VKTLKSIEDRIVNLQKITSDGETSEVEAELRHLDLVGMIPNQIKVVLAREFGVSLTMDWDNSNQRFSTSVDGVTYNSSFDHKAYMIEPWQHGTSYARSSRRS